MDTAVCSAIIEDNAFVQPVILRGSPVYPILHSMAELKEFNDLNSHAGLSVIIALSTVNADIFQGCFILK